MLVCVILIYFSTFFFVVDSHSKVGNEYCYLAMDICVQQIFAWNAHARFLSDIALFSSSAVYVLVMVCSEGVSSGVVLHKIYPCLYRIGCVSVFVHVCTYDFIIVWYVLFGFSLFLIKIIYSLFCFLWLFELE